jgi:hypothetical protein
MTNGQPRAVAASGSLARQVASEPPAATAGAQTVNLFVKASEEVFYA